MNEKSCAKLNLCRGDVAVPLCSSLSLSLSHTQTEREREERERERERRFADRKEFQKIMVKKGKFVECANTPSP
jgi:guanylate kinase